MFAGKGKISLNELLAEEARDLKLTRDEVKVLRFLKKKDLSGRYVEKFRGGRSR